MTPSRVSVSALRGLVYCPAMRPILTTGVEAAYVSTAAICKMVCNFRRMLVAVLSAKDSAQSPPMSTKARPWLAAAI